MSVVRYLAAAAINLAYHSSRANQFWRVAKKKSNLHQSLYFGTEY